MGLNLSLRFNLTLNKGQCFLLNIKVPFKSNKSLKLVNQAKNFSVNLLMLIDQSQAPFWLTFWPPRLLEHKLGHFLTCYEHDLLILKLFRNEISLIFSSEIYKEQFHAHTT